MKRATDVLFIAILIIMVISNVVMAESSDKRVYYGIDCVPNEEVAIEIAKIIIKTMYPIFDLTKYYTVVYLRDGDEVWYVSFRLINTFVRSETPNEYGLYENVIILGGDIRVLIRKNNAEVISIALGK